MQLKRQKLFVPYTRKAQITVAVIYDLEHWKYFKY